MEKPAFRDALGQFATGVCIVTTIHNKAAIGMTVNSFSSVSMDPPLVLWSIQKSSDCYEAFNAEASFAISVLNDQQIELSNKMAQKDKHVLNHTDYSLSQNNMALINDALATFECKPWQHYEGGDHIIIVGEVIDYNKHNGRPLLFCSGTYQELKVSQ